MNKNWAEEYARVCSNFEAIGHKYTETWEPTSTDARYRGSLVRVVLTATPIEGKLSIKEPVFTHTIVVQGDRNPLMSARFDLCMMILQKFCVPADQNPPIDVSMDLPHPHGPDEPA